MMAWATPWMHGWLAEEGKYRVEEDGVGTRRLGWRRAVAMDRESR